MVSTAPPLFLYFLTIGYTGEEYWMILEKLKRETQRYHTRMEKDVDLLRMTTSLARYSFLLQKFWGFYLPVEAKIGRLDDWEQFTFDFDQRRKAALLADDLHTLGVENSVAQLPLCEDIPAFEAFPQALGGMYVLEGATLGGQIIARQCEKSFGFEAASGCAFYRSYGADVGLMWKSFGQFLESYVARSKQPVEDTVISSACETFTSLHRWLVEGKRG